MRVCCNGGLSANLKPFLTLVHRADNQVWCSISPTAPCARTSGCEKTELQNLSSKKQSKDFPGIHQSTEQAIRNDDFFFICQWAKLKQVSFIFCYPIPFNL